MRMGILGVAALGAAVLLPTPAPAVDQPGMEAVLFKAFEADVFANTPVNFECEYAVSGGSGTYFFSDISYATEDSSGREARAVAYTAAARAGVRVTSAGTAVTEPSESVLTGQTASESWGHEVPQPMRVKGAFAVFNSDQASCTFTVGGVAVEGTDLPATDARLLWPEDFDGRAAVAVNDGVYAMDTLEAVEQVGGSLTALVDVMPDRMNPAGTASARVVEPDGTTHHDDRYWELGGDAGTWSIKPTGVVPGKATPVLWLMKLPAGFADEQG